MIFDGLMNKAYLLTGSNLGDREKYLSTSKEFINQLLVFCKEQTAIEVNLEDRKTTISVFVLWK